MRNIGNAQLWYGGKVGVIWEAFFEPQIQTSVDHEDLMHQLWNHLQVYLKDLGVKQVFTYDRDPAPNEQWYQGFLANRGYKCLRATRAVVKALG